MNKSEKKQKLELLKAECIRKIEGSNSLAGDEIKPSNPQLRKIQNGIEKLRLDLNQDEKYWEKSIDLCTDYLQKSKNIKVCGFLWIALLKYNGADGFITGAEIFLSILEGFEDFYPQKNIDRKAEIEFLNDNFGRLSIEETFSSEASNILDLLESIQKKIKLIDPTLSIEKIKDVAKKSISDIDKIQDDQTGKTHKTKEKDKLLEKNDLNENTNKIIISKKNVSQHLISISKQLLDEDMSNPLSYRLSRIAKWDSLKKIPSYKSNHLVNINIEKQNLDFVLKKVNSSKDDPKVTIKICEERFISNPYWLDLQRFIVNSMDKETTFLEASNAIKYELYRLIKRFPDLPDMKWSSGGNIADEETKNWINDLCKNTEEDNNRFQQQNINDKSINIPSLFDESAFNIAFKHLNEESKPEIDINHSYKSRLLAGKLLLKNGKVSEAKIIIE